MSKIAEVREVLDKTISSMYTNPLHSEYLFYASSLSLLEVEFKQMQFPAAVYFCSKRLNYVMIISYSFIEYSLNERMAILKHEISHIIWGHLIDIEDKNINKWRLATDCSINQFINKEHLPQGVILPETLGVPPKLSSYEYYDLLDEPENKEHNHDWESAPSIIKEVTASIIETAKEFTELHGKLPTYISELINPLKSKHSWKNILRNYLINKSKRSSIKRTNRRFNYSHIKGYTKDKRTNLSVILDVSGSITNEDISKALAEILIITHNQDVNLIQVDSEAREPEILTKRTKSIIRTGTGGTFLSSGLSKIKDCNLVLVITDGHLYDEDIIKFNEFKKPILWMITERGRVSNLMKNIIRF